MVPSGARMATKAPSKPGNFSNSRPALFEQAHETVAVGALETQRRRLQRNALRQTEWRAVGKKAHVRGRFFAQLVEIRDDRRPELRGIHRVTHRQRDLEPVPAGRIRVVFVPRIERSRLEHRDLVAITIRKRHLVERLLAEVQPVEVETVVGHRARGAREVAMHERDRRCIEVAIVQADVETAVAGDGVFVRPRIADLEFAETERLVKIQRLEDVVGTHRKLEEVAERAHASAPIAIARVAAAASAGSSRQPARWRSVTAASAATWPAEAFRDGT